MAPTGDPFLWSIDQVVDALCAVGKPWAQDAAALERRIREEEIDGETLLTYEKIFSLEGLLDVLGIKTARRRVLLAKELASLRSKHRSPAYRMWLTAYEKDEEDGVSNLDQNTSNAAVDLGDGDLKETDQNRLLFSKSTINHVDQESMDGMPSLGHKRKSHDMIVATSPKPALYDRAPHPLPDQQVQPAESTNKRKRVAPTWLRKSNDTVAKPRYQWEQPQDGAYIGAGSILKEDITNPFMDLSSWLPDDADDGNFAYMARGRLPPGRCLAVKSVSQRLLRTGVGSVTQSREALRPLLGQLPLNSPRLDADDHVVDFSDFDTEEEEAEDRRIQAEQEDERQEVEAYMKRHTSHSSLTKDRVKAVLEDEIARITSEWRERKKLSLSRKAHRIWEASSRRGTRKLDALDARTKAKYHHERLQKMCAEILEVNYETEKDIREISRALEATVEDKLYHIWAADIVDSISEPPRPETIPRARRATLSKPSNDPELIVSSDEDDFIIDDDEELLPTEAAAEHRPVVSEDEEMADLEQSLVEHATSRADDQPTRAPKPGQDVSPPSRNPPRIDTSREDNGPRTTLSSPGQLQHGVPTEVIDLTTPTKPSSALVSHKKGNLVVDLQDPDPALDEIDARTIQQIANSSARHWSDMGDRYKLVLYMLSSLGFEPRCDVFKTLNANSPEIVWKLSVLTFLEDPPKSCDDLETAQQKADFEITRVFLSFLRVKSIPSARLASPSTRTKAKIRENQGSFGAFCRFVHSKQALFPEERQIYHSELSDNEFEDDYFHAIEEDENGTTTTESRRPHATPRKRKEIVRDKDAVDLRLQEQQRIKDQEERRQKLREALTKSGSISQDKSRLIINESKTDEQSLIYINEEIGKNIKAHQIDGVRFFWNQIIEPDPEHRQGCLLSHTMGLGKTMQVITFLVAIAEASKDSSLRRQIPEDLRRSQTLILCPAGLVNNWWDELLKWDSNGLLGQIFTVDSRSHYEERLDIIDSWAESGGVLVMGYSLFKKFAKETHAGNTSEGQGHTRAAKTAERLLNNASIVVADEAHAMKKDDGKLNKACSRLRTTTRLALTGSPLANHVQEYYAMIDWVAPNFLGPLSEFNQIYVQVIERGLAKDSTSYEKRKASKMLQVLKETVDPKVNRATTKTSSVAKDLPPKMEFMISVPPTALQEKLYELFIDGIGNVEGKSQLMGLISYLGLICAHPHCFRQKIREVDKTPSDHSSFPQQIIGEALSLLNIANVTDPSHSNKIRFLITIVDEARKLREKVLVFSHSLLVLDYLEQLFRKRKIARLDGKSNVSDRQDAIKRFNAGDEEIYLISTKAGGVGLNIHGANRVVLFDSKWNPVDEQQAVGRAYRLGQQKPVMVYHLKLAGSLEETLQDQAIFKAQLAQRVVDKGNPVAWGKRSGQYDVHLRPVKKIMDLTPFRNKDPILDSLIESQPGEGHITKIVLTDTLEEEDPTSALTEEEKAEATRLVRLNELRRLDPALWAEEKAKLDREEGIRQMAQLAQGDHERPQTTIAPSQHAVASLGSGSVLPWPQTSSSEHRSEPHSAAGVGSPQHELTPRV